MTLQQILYVLTIAEQGSLNKAANTLYVSQPTLTSALNAIEKETGMTIFKRTSKGIEPTKEGNRFIADMTTFYSQYQMLSDKYIEPGEKKERFEVSTQHYSFVVQSFVSTIKKLGLDNYELAIKETKTMDVIQDVGKADSEIGIIYLSEFNRKYIMKLLDEADLQFTSLTKCNACVYVYKDNPLANRKEISLEDLQEYPCCSFDQGNDNQFYLAEEILTENEFARSIKVSDRATMLNLLVGMNGYTLCPGIICEQLNGDNCRIIPYKEDAQNPNRVMEIGYITRKNTIISGVGQQFITEMNNYFNEIKPAD